MWDSYDPRDDDPRERGDAWTRDLGGRGGRDDRDQDRPDDPRRVFVGELDLPRGAERELVREPERDRTYELNGTDSRLLATVGAFRVVAESDLESGRDRTEDARKSLAHLEGEGLTRSALRGPGERVVFLTGRGRDLLEASHRERDDERPRDRRQEFYAGLRKPRELSHDSQVYRAYLKAEERLRSQGGRVRRVALDYELKREYQQFRQRRNRGRKDSDGRPDHDVREIQAWAREHDLPYFDGHVHFPDVRIEYEDRDRCRAHEDVEVTTEHYRGAHAAVSVRSGFTCYRGIGGVSGRGGRRRSGGPSGPRLAEELL